MDNNKKDTIAPKGNSRKDNSNSHPEGLRGQTSKLSVQSPAATNSIEDELLRLRAAGTAVQKIRLSAQRELELARQMRTEAQRYRQETETKARSQAQLLILHARLATQKEIEEVKRKANEEIHNLLDEIHAIRMTAREELEAQRLLNDAARIRALSQAVQVEAEQKFEDEKEVVGAQKV